MFSQEKYWIRSLPINLEWEGWRASTVDLQRAGWQLSAEQDLMSGSVRIAMKNERYKIYGVSQKIPYNYFEEYSLYKGANITIPVQQMASRLHIEMMETSFKFVPIDAEPQFMNRERKSIEDFAIFAPALIRTNEIIVPNETVDDLLQRILEIQDPMVKKYYKEESLKNFSGSNINAIPEQKFIAQIISIDGYRKAA